MPSLTPSAIVLLCAACVAVGYALARLTGRAKAAALQQAMAEVEGAKSRAREEVLAAEAAQRRFMAAVNHESRTPLNGVAGTASLLLEQPLDPLLRQAVEAIRGSSDALLKTLDDLLDLSRLEAGDIELTEEVFSPTACLKEAFSILSAQARTLQKRLVTDVRASVPAAASGDPSRLRQVALQVVGYALTHTRRDEVRVSVSVRPLDDSTQELTLSVSDHGETGEKVPKIRLFEPLARSLGPSDRALSGSDVGLSISRLVCERMGGRVQVDPDASSGETARLAMNLRIAAALPEPVEQVSGPLRPCALLLVEDNPVNQKVAVAMLGKLGCKADLAVNGQEALEATAKRAYDVILMDVQMPIMDGLEATRRIVGGAHLGPRPWIIAVTANTMPGDKELCLRAGMNDYVAKPLKPPVLRAALERGLAAR